MLAHPGSGIVVDRQGQVYFVDTGSGLWQIDAHGTLIRIPAPMFHWMTLDADDRFGSVRLPSGSSEDITRVGSLPSLLLASDFPLAMGRDGNLDYPSRGSGGALDILRLLPSGRSSVLTSVPLRHLDAFRGHLGFRVHGSKVVRRQAPGGSILVWRHAESRERTSTL